MAGRPPKPTRLKVLSGNPGRRPLNGSEPRHDRGAPKCPGWLGKRAKAAWKQIVPVLDSAGLLTVADGWALACLCQAWAEMEEATRTLDTEGRTFQTENGYKVPHPAVAQQRSAWQAIRQYSALFGLDPSSRSKLAVPSQGGEESDPFAEFSRGRKAN